MKSTKKFISVLLAVLMLMTCVSGTFTALAAATTPALTGKYATNPNGVGVKKTISIDGSISDWDSSMLIAQGVANDDPRVYRPNSMYEIPVDNYALYGAWDDTNLYLMWELTNVQDVVAPNDDYPISQGNQWINNIPFFIALDLDSSVSGDGTFTTGQTIWDSGITFDEGVDTLIAYSTNGSNGPFIYPANSSGKFDYSTAIERTATGISMKWDNGIVESEVIGANYGYGEYNNRVIGDTINDTAEWVEFNSLGHDSDKLDMHYEMSIPLASLGITASDITSKGIGVMQISTFGTSGMDCLPYDPSMNDNADQPATKSQEFNSLEKEDADHITVPFARIGKLSVDQPVTQPTTVAPTTTQPTTVAPTTTQPTTAAPTATQPTTAVPASDTLTVNAKSNLFATNTYEVSADAKTVTVRYDLSSAMDVVNGQWKLTYDTSKLRLKSDSATIMPNIYDGVINCQDGVIKGNFTNVSSLYDFSTSKSFVEVTFDVIGKGNTDVTLDVQELSVGYLQSGKLTYKNAVVNSTKQNLSGVSGFTTSSISGSATVIADQVATTATTATTTTAKPTTQPTTVVSDKLTVNATSNFFPAASKTYDANEKEVTVSFKLQSALKLMNSEWKLTYDTSKLSFDKAEISGLMPNIASPVIRETTTGIIKGNFTNLALEDFKTEKDFITITFDVLGTGTADVDLYMDTLSVAYVNSNYQSVEAYVVSNGTVKDVTSTPGFENETYAVKTVFGASTVEPTTQPTTTATQPATQPTTKPTDPDTDTLKVNATSNISNVFSPVSEVYSEADDTVTVTYKLQSSMKLVNGNWNLYYDNTKLSFDPAKNADGIMPNIPSAVINTGLGDRIEGAFTNLSLYNFKTEKDYVTVTFDIIGTGETTVNLEIELLGVAYLDSNNEAVIAYPVDYSQYQDVTDKAGFENLSLSGRIVLNEPASDDYLLGDVNDDGLVNVNDATLIQKYAASRITFTDDQILRADVNKDGVVNVADATLVQKYAVGRITSFE